jgi:pyrroloquinoline quinone biosynthesis protein B
VTGDNIALRIENLRDGSSLFYSPGLAEVGAQELAWMHAADCVLVDGTFWQEDEMQRAGLGTKSARDMGHLPQQPDGNRPGMVDALRDAAPGRKVLIHINNSNPILDEDSAPRRTLEALGIEVAHDGMEIQP